MPIAQTLPDLTAIRKAHRRAKIEVRRDGVVHVYDGRQNAPLTVTPEEGAVLFSLFQKVPEFSDMKTLVFGFQPEDSQCLA